jgi:hypothetical protein
MPYTAQELAGSTARLAFATPLLQRPPRLTRRVFACAHVGLQINIIDTRLPLRRLGVVAHVGLGFVPHLVKLDDIAQ